MKKLTALLLALVMLTFAFASCGDDKNDPLDGKTFTYEKFEIELEDKELAEKLNAVIEEGQTLSDYIFEEFIPGDVTETRYRFKNGKMSIFVGEKETISKVDYQMDEDKISEINGKPVSDNVNIYLKDGKLIREYSVDETIFMFFNIKATVRVIYQ